MIVELAGQTAFAYTGGRPLDPALPLVVFIHGASNDHSVWSLQSRYLAHHGHAVLAIDLPGHGRSAGPPLASIEAIADWVLNFIPAALAASSGARSGALRGLPPLPTAASLPPDTGPPASDGAQAVSRPPAVALVGHSMGSLVALECTGRLAGSAFERAGLALSGLGLIGTAVPMRVSDALLQAAEQDEARALDLINFWSHSALTHPPGSPAPGVSLFIHDRRLMERQKPGVLLNDFRACNAYEAGLRRARDCALPVLLLLGGADSMTPVKAARELTATLPRQRTQVLDGAGHALMGERPDAVLAALRAWLAEL